MSAWLPKTEADLAALQHELSVGRTFDLELARRHLVFWPQCCPVCGERGGDVTVCDRLGIRVVVHRRCADRVR